MKFIKFLLGLTTLTASTIGFAQNSSEKEWQQVYDAREAIYEKNIGKLPNDIMKAPNLFGIWPGGGFYVIPADKIKKGLWVYSTFGFTNSDMPSTVTATEIEVEHDNQGRVISSSSKLEKKSETIPLSGKAGHGYEVLMIAKENAELAGVGHLIDFEVKDMKEWKTTDENGFLITNPPYGERLSSEDRKSPTRNFCWQNK